WHDILDEHQIETAVCFPTGSGSVVRLQELPFQIAVARACNDHFAAEYNALSDRVKCVGVLPLRSPQAAAEELERAAKEQGLIGFEILPVGLPVALGDSVYDPVYAAAERCGVALGIHGTRRSRELGAGGLNTFAEVHAYAFTAGILLQFTSMICQGCRFVFPNCAWRSWRLARPGCRTTWIASTSIEKNRPSMRCLCSKKDPADW